METAPAVRGCMARAGDIVEPSRAACGYTAFGAACGCALGEGTARGGALAGAVRGYALGSLGGPTMGGTLRERGGAALSEQRARASTMRRCTYKNKGL